MNAEAIILPIEETSIHKKLQQFKEIDYKTSIKKIGLGTVQFGTTYGINNKYGKTTSNEVDKILNLATSNGINLIDTASAYGDAEEVLGKNNLAHFNIVSKFMPVKRGDSIKMQFNKSIEDLHVASLYGYLAHRPLALIDDLKTWEELQNLKKDGLIKKIGFSLNEPSELEALLEHGLIPDLIQVPYNYFDSRFENQMISFKEKGCEIHTRSTFLQGLFFMNPVNLNPYFEEVKVLIEKLQQNTKSLANSLLRYVLEKTFIDKVIIGVENSNQFRQNIEMLGDAEKLPMQTHSISENILMPSKWPK